ncbi:MAG: hypothetical protein ICV76_07530 [Nitrospiraceae bacterium]|nr:hypothetical protein [Nitrospiraceae bacterium]
MNTTPYPEVSDYALIGDSRTAALTSIHGSIDWLCLPRFDGLSLFNRLLDYWHGGHFTITPTRSYSSRRHYQTSTAILVTEFQTDEGSVRVTDLVPVLSEAEKRTCLLPFWSLLRRIDGIEGTVELDMVFKPRPEHGRVIPQFHSRGRAGYFADLGDRLLHLATDVSLQIKKGEVGGRFMIRAGEQRVFWFAYSEDAPAVYPVVSQAGRALDKTRAFWETWAERCTYRGPHRNAVIRSAVTLKLLSFAPSGAIVAAPTTALPEAIGGERNWDYRYCWLRDAAYTVRCFFKLGYTDEATAFVLWLMHATTLTAPALKVLYALCGETFFLRRIWSFSKDTKDPSRCGPGIGLIHNINSTFMEKCWIAFCSMSKVEVRSIGKWDGVSLRWRIWWCPSGAFPITASGRLPARAGTMCIQK